MNRARLLATTLGLCAAGALAAGLPPQESDRVEIEVTAGTLAECRATLARVATAPVRADDGGPVFLQPTDDLPEVVCVDR